MPPAIITLKAQKTGICHVTRANSDSIHALKVTIDTQKKQLRFFHPKGIVYTAPEQIEDDAIHFSSDHLIWENSKELLILQDNIDIDQKGIGHLISNKEVHLQQGVENGKKVIKSMSSSGTTQLTYKNGSEADSHSLTCHGHLIIDHENLFTTMESPLDAQSQVLKDKQIYFEDHTGKIYADHLRLDYENLDSKITPVKLTLTGHVYMINTNSGKTGEASLPLQYAMADKVEYYHKTQEMIFTANKPARVLFLDKVNNIQISAPQLKMRRDDLTKKEIIQGAGDVRFQFIEEEFEQLKKHFLLDHIRKN